MTATPKEKEFARRLVAEAAEPYRQAGQYAWRFARGKLGGDPAFAGLLSRGLLAGRRRVLDIGCGLGAYVAHFRRFTDEAYGIDVDAPRVREGRRRGIDKLILAAAEHLPFADGTFDVIVLNEVIEHVNDDRATLREA